jgi:manganese transport protein
MRRVITRSMAVVPAILVIGLVGENSANDLLVLSQIVLGLQLPLALFPLMHFTCSKKRMGRFVNPVWLQLAGWGCTLSITALDLYLIIQKIIGVE